MKAVKTLPVDYEPIGMLDFSQSKAALIVVNVIGLVLMGLFIWLGVWFLGLVFPGVDVILALWSVTGGVAGLGGRVLIVVLALVVTLGAGVLHELVHGLFFWVFTRERPAFGARSLYFYASAPDWYLPRSQHVLVGLSPLILVTIIGLVVALLASPAVAAWVLLAVVANAGGAAGDLMAAFWLLRQPAETFVRDTGLALTIYQPGPGSGEVVQEGE
ncbi:MAG: DUF3267 domain-containing protein [Anaerolineae bacterium]|nr:DUF3267 domain-containing protein [Anaerolineae bacterium]